MHLQGGEMLARGGYAQYEISAYALAGRRCRHNLNYWTFGDYLGIGAGAHGKLSHAAQGRIERHSKLRHPAAYLSSASPSHLESSRHWLSESDLVLEFAMNALRLVEGFDRGLFERHTGLPYRRIADTVEQADRDRLLRARGERVRPTRLGRLFLDDLIGRFCPD
jgi:oxygen-independent coproporphyrinogen-3 oxidase